MPSLMLLLRYIFRFNYLRQHNHIQSTEDTSAVTNLPCPEATDPSKDAFQSDTALMNFLTASTLSLWKKVAGQANDTLLRKNLCNSQRKIDIATLYLAKSLGLSVSNIVANFVYDEGATYTFPNHSTNGPDVIYPPPDVYFPNLEQTYWTIMSQYTVNTEPAMRTRQRRDKWCWIEGRGLYDHCQDTKSSLSCPAGTPHNLCTDIWKNFVEACHRVHSLDTGLTEYRVRYGKNPNYVCSPYDPDYKYYELSRL